MKSNPFAHRSPRQWQKITLCLPEDQADMAASFLMELTGSGIEQQVNAPELASHTETLIAYLEKDEQFDQNKKHLEQFLESLALHPAGNSLPSISYTDILEEDWNKKWKAFYKPLRLTETITVKPTWEPYDPEENELVIEIDPGMAFGTGLHDSTQLALQLIERSFSDLSSAHLQRILDVGTGTGILGMACALLGAKDVVAIDNDPDAVAAALDNARYNNLSHLMTVSTDDIAEAKGPFDLIAANITQDVISMMAPGLSSLLATGGRLVLAGILQGEQAETITRIFQGLGLTLLHSPTQKEWQAFLFEK
jgi:ribosomal protein L11 methyltransferase